MVLFPSRGLAPGPTPHPPPPRHGRCDAHSDHVRRLPSAPVASVYVDLDETFHGWIPFVEIYLLALFLTVLRELRSTRILLRASLAHTLGEMLGTPKRRKRCRGKFQVSSSGRDSSCLCCACGSRAEQFSGIRARIIAKAVGVPLPPDIGREANYIIVREH